MTELIRRIHYLRRLRQRRTLGTWAAGGGGLFMIAGVMVLFTVFLGPGTLVLAGILALLALASFLTLIFSMLGIMFL